MLFQIKKFKVLFSTWLQFWTAGIINRSKKINTLFLEICSTVRPYRIDKLLKFEQYKKTNVNLLRFTLSLVRAITYIMTLKNITIIQAWRHLLTFKSTIKVYTVYWTHYYVERWNFIPKKIKLKINKFIHHCTVWCTKRQPCNFSFVIISLLHSSRFGYLVKGNF